MKTKQNIQENNHDIARTHNALYQNAIINGNMEIWQDGTSFAAMASGTHMADMWRYWKNGAMVHAGSQDTDTPNDQLNYSLKIDTTTADAAIAAGDHSEFQIAIEGYDWKKIVGKYVTLSFWAKSVVTGTYCVSLINAGVDRSYVAEYTINTASTWEYKTITVPLDYSGGTWDYTNGAGIFIRFALDAGSTYQTTANTWQNGNLIGTSNQVNFSASTDNNFWLTGVQLNEGRAVSQWNPRTFEEEMKKCQRYYEKSYAYSTYPGTSTTVNCMQGSQSVAAQATPWCVQARFLVRKRLTPTVTWYSTATGTAARIRDVSAATDRIVSGNSNTEGDLSTGYAVCTTTFADGATVQAHWVADARF